MKKTFLSLSLAMLTVSVAICGGIVTNTNQSIHFDRMFARGASMEIDAVYSNPAGLVFLKDGFHASINMQTVQQARYIYSDFPLYKNSQKTFRGETFVPIYPSVHLAYKKDKWVFSGSFSVTGGGGKAEFNGLPMFEASIASLPSLLSQMGIPTNEYSVDSYLNGQQYIYGVQLGASYKINDMWSGFLGVRMNLAKNLYEGYIRNISINPIFPGINPDGNMIPASTFFTAIGQSTYAKSTSDMELYAKQKGVGFTPILGLNFHYQKWNIGLKYEITSNFKVENQTDINTLPEGKKESFDDGVKTDNGIPGLLTLGVQYEILPVLRAAVGSHYYFDKQAKMAVGKEQLLDRSNMEYLAGIEWDVTKILKLSTGGQITRFGGTDAFQSDLSFSLNSYSWGIGGAVQLSPKVALNFSYFFTKYEKWQKNMTNYQGTGIPGTDTYHRYNDVFGLGLDISL